ncbi:MAG: hypothetical protein LH479_06885 [Polaromonas sp.]|nr:hypothetical protein [Polaromonas sp.]
MPTVAAVVTREFKVNTTKLVYSNTPEIANLKDGGYIIAWSNPFFGTAEGSIRAQRYGPDGESAGSEIILPVGIQPKLAALEDGGFVLAYNFYDAATSNAGLRLLKFKASDQSDFTREVLATFTDSGQIAGLPNGGYTWLYTTSSGRNLDFFNKSNQQVAHTAVSNGVAGIAPVIFVSADGVVHLVSSDSPATYPATAGAHIFEQRFDSTGSTLGAPALRVTSPTNAFDLSASPMADGSYAIAYARSVEANEPRTSGVSYTSASAVVAQMFDAAGSPVGSEVVPDLEKGVAQGIRPTNVPRLTVPCPTPAQGRPKVLPLQQGGYVLSWKSPNRPGLQGVRYESRGTPNSVLLKLTSTSPDYFEGYAATRAPSSIPVLAWAPPGAEGNGRDIVAKQWPSDGPR